MFSFLKNHPFAIEAFFERSIVLTFAFPKEDLQPLIPECLELDTFDDRYAFVAVALVSTKNLRPKGFPKFMGNDFFLIGRRIFVNYHTNAGKRYRGLYIIKSETNKGLMKNLGNFFTRYNYTKTDIEITKNTSETVISSQQSDFRINIDDKAENVALPGTSVFENWKQARRFAGPLPFTFTYNKPKKEVLIIQGMRQNWKPKPLKINSLYLSFLKKEGFKNGVFTSAFEVSQIPYYWKKGKKEKWNG